MKISTLCLSGVIVSLSCQCMIANAQNNAPSNAKLVTPSNTKHTAAKAKPSVSRANPTPLSPEFKQLLQDENTNEANAESAFVNSNFPLAEACAIASVKDGDYFQEGGLLGTILLAEGKTSEAAQVLQTECEVKGNQDPSNSLPYALALYNEGQFVKAAAEYNLALPRIAYGHLLQDQTAFTPDNVLSRENELAADIYIGMGLTEFDERANSSQPTLKHILSRYQSALALEPASPLTNLYYAYGLNIAGRTVDAQAALKKLAATATGEIKDATQDPEF